MYIPTDEAVFLGDSYLADQLRTTVRFQSVRAITEERKREARDCPEQGKFETTAFIGKEPAVSSSHIGRDEQVNSQKERDPSCVDPQDQRQSADRFVQHDQPGEPFR